MRYKTQGIKNQSLQGSSIWKKLDFHGLTHNSEALFFPRGGFELNRMLTDSIYFCSEFVGINYRICDYPINKLFSLGGLILENAHYNLLLTTRQPIRSSQD